MMGPVSGRSPDPTAACRQTIADTGAVSGCQVYYPAGARITLATAKADSDCWDSSQISKTNPHVLRLEREHGRQRQGRARR